MQGRISRLDHHNSAPEYAQTDEARWSTHSTSESFGRRNPLQTGSSASSRMHRGAPPLRSALKRPGESRTSLTSSSSVTSGRGSESNCLEPSSSCCSLPKQASIENFERPSRTGVCIEFSDPTLRHDIETSPPVDPPFLVLNESLVRTPTSNPPRKQNLVSALISRLRTGRRPADSAPTPPTSDAVPPRSQTPFLSQYPSCDMPEDVPTIEIRNFTPSDSSHDTPSPSGPEPPARKTVRFAIWSHMRTFERPEWEPIGQAYEGAYEEATYNKSNKPGGRALLRKKH